MGDRGNIVILDENGKPGIYLYTHWNGSGIGSILQRALSRKQRWDDPSYLTRIIFCEMVKGEESGGTGYGISTIPPDNEHAFLSVDINARSVYLRPENGPDLKGWSFVDFIALREIDQLIAGLEARE